MRALIYSILWLPTLACAAPSWYETLEPKAGYYTATGLGESIAVAKTEARKQLANAVSSKVSTSVVTSVETEGEASSIRTQGTSKISSDSILLPDIEWRHVEMENGIYYVLGEVSKDELVKLYERTIQFSAKKFDHLLSKRDLTLADYFSMLSSQSELEELAAQSSVIFDKSSQGKQHYTNIMSLFDTLSSYKDQSCFTLKYKGHSSYDKKIFTPMLEDAFIASGTNLRDEKRCETIAFNANSSTERHDGVRTETIRLQIDMGQPVAESKSITITGTSRGSKKEAMSNVSTRFSEHFNHQNSLMLFMLNKQHQNLNI